MIKHHPDQELLGKFAEGELPAALAAAIAAHVDMCPQCRAFCTAHMEQQAQLCFETNSDELLWLALTLWQKKCLSSKQRLNR